MAEAGMRASRRIVVALLGCYWLPACGDSTGPRPVGLMWLWGASGAFVGDTISLVVFYRDAAGDPIPFPRPSVAWSSSQPGIVLPLATTVPPRVQQFEPGPHEEPESAAAALRLMAAPTRISAGDVGDVRFLLVVPDVAVN
jgi:hypothetical protein